VVLARSIRRKALAFSWTRVPVGRAPAAAAPLAPGPRYPLAVAVAVSASFLLNRAAGVDMYSFWATIFAGLITAYTAAAHLRPRLAALALACLYAAIAVSSLHGPGNLLWGGILIGGAALAGFALRDRRRHVSQLAELAHQLELARDETARAAVAGKRARGRSSGRRGCLVIRCRCRGWWRRRCRGSA
jgi:hypothetical protein